MLEYANNTMTINGKRFQLEHPIADAFEGDGKVIILFNPDAKTETFGQFQNLIAVGFHGEPLWIAELPTTTTGDRYYKIASRKPLVVYSVQSYECEVDSASGAILSRRFVK